MSDKREVLYQALCNLEALKKASATAPSVTAAALMAYARREAAHLHDLRIERALRANPMARALYLQALQQLARDASLQAAAAAAGGIHRRPLQGGGVLEIIEDEGGAFLVIRLGETTMAESASPTMLEVRTPEGEGGRTALPPPDEGIVQRRLDSRREDERQLLTLLTTRPDAAVFLL